MGRKSDGPPPTSGHRFGFDEAVRAAIPWEAIRPRSMKAVEADRQERKELKEIKARGGGWSFGEPR